MSDDPDERPSTKWIGQVADRELEEHLAADDALGAHLRAWRDEARAGVDDVAPLDAIYRQLRDELLVDDVPVHGPGPRPVELSSLDAQSRAFRDMGPDDVVADDELGGYAAAVHAPLGATPPVEVLALPEDYERAPGGWDHGREDSR